MITAGQAHHLKMDEGHHRPSFKAVGTTAVAAGYMHQYKDGRESQPRQDFTRTPGSPALSRSNSTSSTISSSGSVQPSYRGDYNYEKRPTKTLDLPFSPVSRDYEHNGLVNQIELEESVWTAAMVSWLLCPQELQMSRWGWMSFILPPQLALILCIVTQFFFAYFVYDVHHDMTTLEADCDNESSKLLHFFALCVFLSYGFGSEIMEALAMHRWISCFPDWEPKHQDILDEIKKRDRHLWTAFLCCRLATNEDGFSALVPIVGLSRKFRWFIRFYCIGLRLAIATYTMIAAAHLIVYATTNKEVIENAVVATFILEIDDYYFKFLITDMIKMDMKAIPALGIAPGIGMSQADATWQYYGSYVLVTTLALGAVSLSIGWCDRHGDQTIPMAIVIFLVPLSLIVGFLTYQSTKPWKSPTTSVKYAPLAYRGWRELPPPPRDEEEGKEEETREAEGPSSRSQSGKITPTVDGEHSEQVP